MLEVIGGDLLSPNYWDDSKYGIPGYACNNWYQSISISVITNDIRADVFVQDSSALNEEEDVKSMEYGRDIKMKKTTRKFKFVLK